MSPTCEVCKSPTANTLHFGGRTCKACAAFFRRTVSMDMGYLCIGNSNGTGRQCNVHYELRMICRRCRYLKCISAGMKRELVQCRKERHPTKRRAADLIAYDADDMGDLLPRSPKSELAEKNEHEPITKLPSPNSDAKRRIEEIKLEDPDECSGDYQCDSVPSTSSPSTTPAEFDQPSCSRGLPPVVDDDWAFTVLESYISLEVNLNDRRKVLYTDCGIRELVSSPCDMPFRKEQLKHFDYKTFRGYDRYDYLMIYDYTKEMPEWANFSPNDKCLIYRFACAVDCMISCAYYTAQIGMESKLLILFNGEALKMDPLPPTGLEPEHERLFRNKEDWNIYKTIMPTKIKQWRDMAVPFAKLNVTFEEYCLLKALTIHHITFYKLSPEGRKRCARLRDQIICALHRLCIEKGDDPAVRIGGLLLAMGFVLEQVHELISCFMVMTFFDIVKCDQFATELLHLHE